MKADLILKVLREIYRIVLRDALIKYVKSTETEWDDRLVDLCDLLLGYKD